MTDILETQIYKNSSINCIILFILKSSDYQKEKLRHAVTVLTFQSPDSLSHNLSE